jgi:hypothetical protein
VGYLLNGENDEPYAPLAAAGVDEVQQERHFILTLPHPMN